MKVLIVNASDVNGGAAKAAFRLHESLLEQGVDSYMLVQSKDSGEDRIITNTSKIHKISKLIRPTIDRYSLSSYKKKSATMFSPSWIYSINVVNMINSFNADVVHFHWINNSMLRIEDIAKIKAPLLWSLHDMWPFTGGCHYDESCGRYVDQCGKCKVLKSSKERDLSRKVYLRKKKTFSKIKIHIVGLSRWLSKCSLDSSLLGNMPHYNIPNPINTDRYKPLDSNFTKELWGIPKDRKVILFGAMNSTSDKRKGYAQLIKALEELVLETENVDLIVFGSSKRKTENHSLKIRYVGTLSDDVSLCTLYNSADVMVVPSLQENLSNTIMEGLSCGLPVVGFNIGGNSDLINHKKNGYLAEPFSVEDLKYGIQWVLTNSNYDKLSFLARKKVLSTFDSSIVSKKYIELYNNILKKES